MREDSERSGIFVVQYVQGGGKSRWLGQSSRKEEYRKYENFRESTLPLQNESIILVCPWRRGNGNQAAV